MELKSLKELTEEEKIEFVKKEWENPNMQQWLLKNYDYYKTPDNYIIEIEKAAKLSITKTLYYDDEFEAPEVNFDNFIEHNRHNCNRYDYYLEKANKTYNRFYFAKNGNLNNVCIMVYSDFELSMNLYYENIRELLAEEKQDILELYKRQKEGYIKRLERYFKKYKNNIFTCGYWANR